MMKRFILFVFLAVLILAALPAGADQTYSYWAWHSKTDDDIYCFSFFPNIWYYYTYQQVGGKTIYCDNTESSWGATWCELDVRLEEATPCYYGSIAKPGTDPSHFYFGAPPSRRRALTMPGVALAANTMPLKGKSCAKS
jgi:hypothetical protein